MPEEIVVNRWPRPEDAGSNVTRLLRPLSRDRQIPDVPFDGLASVFGALLDDWAEEAAAIEVSFHPQAPGRVTVDLRELDDPGVIFDGGDIKDVETYMQAMEQRVRSGNEGCTQIVFVHRDGWFCFSSRERHKAPIIPWRFP